MVKKIIRITTPTNFKLRPEQVSLLQPEEIFPVAAGTVYDIHSYAYADSSGGYNGHIKFALENTSIRGLNTWYVYRIHAQVEFDGEVVYPREDQEALPILWINQDTVIKRRPLQSSMLPPEEKFEVRRGRSYTLDSYAYADAQGDFSNHIKFALRYSEDYIRGLTTWFAYDQHAHVEIDGEVVYPRADPNTPVLRILQDTVLKRRPVQSSELPADQKAPVVQGTVFPLSSFAYPDPSIAENLNGHIKFGFKYASQDIRDMNTWYVYEGHARLERQGQVIYPRPTPAPTPTPTPTPAPPYTGRPIQLPGNTGTFYTDQPIIPGGSFTWGEATKNGTRIPATPQIVDNIVALARPLQRARNQIGRPFQINSWYRPPDINAAVGGVPNSQHLTGKAVDLQVAGYSGRRLANILLLWWPGGIGIYSHLPNVIHLDIGPKRTWGF